MQPILQRCWVGPQYPRLLFNHPIKALEVGGVVVLDKDGAGRQVSLSHRRGAVA